MWLYGISSFRILQWGLQEVKEKYKENMRFPQIPYLLNIFFFHFQLWAMRNADLFSLYFSFIFSNIVFFITLSNTYGLIFLGYIFHLTHNTKMQFIFLKLIFWNICFNTHLFIVNNIYFSLTSCFPPSEMGIAEIPYFIYISLLCKSHICFLFFITFRNLHCIIRNAKSEGEI